MVELREKVYQMFILGTVGDGYQKALAEGLGGIIFFSKDITGIEQIKNLTAQCKKLAKISPFLSIDQECGRVERTENIHNGKKYLSAKFAFEKNVLIPQTTDIANELKILGFNLNFAPCVDVNTNPNNPIIGERAFSNRAEDVVKCAKIVSDTYKQYGIIPCIKHFPGHGDTDTDSHLALPKIELSLNEMEKTHILPFKAMIEYGIDMIMIAHIFCKCFDDKVIPASLSDSAIKYLRNNLKYNGIIISDDMVMKGVSELYNPLEACLKGINAGINMFIYRNSDKITLDTIEQIISVAKKDAKLAEKIDNSYRKILQLKQKYGV